ncbi:ribosomal protein L31e-domain-containing protein [Hysterangium stoloniferum]|nr:ribosomal protein L31e-domain-containing protein [Hysterangium stoloniferum]
MLDAIEGVTRTTRVRRVVKNCIVAFDVPHQTPKTRSALQDVVTREYTIHLHKHVHGRSFKKRSPWAVKSVVEFAQKTMGTKEVRIDPKLNEAIWAKGVKNVPHRLRVKLERKRTEEDGAKEKLFTYASYVPVVSFKGLQTVVVDAE